MGQGRVGPVSERDLFALLGQQIDKVQRTKWEDKVSEKAALLACFLPPLSILLPSFLGDMRSSAEDSRLYSWAQM
jgi:hypothetical protein